MSRKGVLSLSTNIGYGIRLILVNIPYITKLIVRRRTRHTLPLTTLPLTDEEILFSRMVIRSTNTKLPSLQ